MMPEGVKIPQRASPLARAGAGDSSAERGALHTTPPPRMQPAHPKRQLFSVPVNKFTAKASAPSPNLVRIRSCLKEYRSTPVTPVKIAPKAVSMEDLTPTKRMKKERKAIEPTVRGPGLHSVAEEKAAARIGRFMLVAMLRKRRDETRCLRKTLEFQVSCSERLRIQVCTLKSLLDSDNAKVRLAMRELDRLKQMVRDKDLEKAVLEKVVESTGFIPPSHRKPAWSSGLPLRFAQEKCALEQDVCAAEDRASEMSIGWRNCRNELECARAANASTERALALERAAAAEARTHCDRAFDKLSQLEEELSQQSRLLGAARAQAAALRRDHDDKLRQLQRARDQLSRETEARERCSRECSTLSVRVELSAQETNTLKAVVAELRAQLQRVELELKLTREQLDWWPRPLTKMLGAARSWLRHPVSIPEAMLWSLIPARHGC